VLAKLTDSGLGQNRRHEVFRPLRFRSAGTVSNTDWCWRAVKPLRKLGR